MATSLISPAPSSTGPADVIAWQRERKRAGAFEILGKIWMLNLEACAGAHVPGKAVANQLGSRLEWYNEAGGPEVLGPTIAQTGAKGQLIILDPIVRADGAVGLPDLPDPTWKPRAPRPEEISYSPPPRPKNAPQNWQPPKPPVYTPEKAPMIPQHLIDRGDGYGGRASAKITTPQTTYLVCQPVVQIVVRPIDGQHRVRPTGWILKCLPSTEVEGCQSTLMSLLIDANTGEAFLYGGRFEISDPGGG